MIVARSLASRSVAHLELTSLESQHRAGRLEGRGKNLLFKSTRFVVQTVNGSRRIEFSCGDVLRSTMLNLSGTAWT